MSDKPIITFSVSSGFGHRTRQGYVQVIIEAADFMTQMPPETARDLAQNLLTAAEAADSDRFLMTFMMERVGADEQRAAQILMDFREWREKERRRVDLEELKRLTEELSEK